MILCSVLVHVIPLNVVLLALCPCRRCSHLVKAAVRVCTQHPGALPHSGQPPEDESGRKPQIHPAVALLSNLRRREASKNTLLGSLSRFSAHADDGFPDGAAD